jgi:predicted ATPase
VAIQSLRIAGYRSIREINLKPGRLTVLVGPNGCGKSNIYRGLELIAAAAQGRLARLIAEEGGMPSALWAGPRGRGPVRMILSVQVDAFSYEVQCGLPTPIPGGSMFQLDPEIKEEHVWFYQGSRKTVLLERTSGTIHARDGDGNRITYPLLLAPSDTALAELREPEKFPVLAMLRDEFVTWRFYHQFRSDRESPIRRPQPGCRTPILSPDGSDLAAAIQTIREVGNVPALNAAVERAFPGSSLVVFGPDQASAGYGFSLGLQTAEFQRPFHAVEFSDGTLQYLCLLAALLSPRPPTFLALNEPESSLHPNLLEPLARLIVAASEKSQVWVTTHSTMLADCVQKFSSSLPMTLTKLEGETRVAYPDSGSL